MTAANTEKQYLEEFAWNVEQNLTGAKNNSGIHHYLYHHNGERIMKSSVRGMSGGTDGEGGGKLWTSIPIRYMPTFNGGGNRILVRNSEVKGETYYMHIKTLTILIGLCLSSCTGINNDSNDYGDRLDERQIEKEVLFNANCQYSKAKFFIAHTKFSWTYYSRSGVEVITKSYDLELFNKELIKLLSPKEVDELDFYNFWIESQSCDCVEIMLSIVKEDTDQGYNPLIKVCGNEAKYLREI